MSAKTRTAALAGAAKKVKALRTQEAAFLNQAQNAKTEALLVAYAIGEVIETEVIGAYGEGRMEEFATLCGFEKKTAYNYLYLYRAAQGRPVIKQHADLPRTYWYALGSSIRWQDDVMGDALRRRLLQQPPWRDAQEGEPPDPEEPQRKQVVDKKMIQDVCNHLNDLRTELAKDGILYAFKKYDLYIGKSPNSPDEMWELLGADKGMLYTNRTAKWEVKGKGFTSIDWHVYSDIEVFYIVAFNKGDEDKYQKALENIALKWDDISQSLGRPDWIHLDIGPKTKGLLEKNRLPPDVYKKGYDSVVWKRAKRQKRNEVLQQTGGAELIELEKKVILGDCVAELKTEAFSKRMIDVCLTDPPYGKYDKWRESVKVDYNELGSPEEAAALVGRVAEVLVQRELIKSQFIWMSFCPMDAVHIFLPPILKAFDGLSYIHQVLVWDKERAGPVGTPCAFVRHAEAILYVNVGDRPLNSITIDNREEKRDMHPNIFRCRAQLSFWSN